MRRFAPRLATSAQSSANTPPRTYGSRLKLTPHHIIRSAHSCGETSTVVRCLGPKVLGKDFAVRRASEELNAQLLSHLCFHGSCVTIMTPSFTCPGAQR
jgi:hypothetical protein